RYIAFDQPVAGLGYRYHRSAELGAGYERAMDALFEDYGSALRALQPWVAERFPRGEGRPTATYERAVRAKALDRARGLLRAAPGASRRHPPEGMFASCTSTATSACCSARCCSSARAWTNGRSRPRSTHSPTGIARRCWPSSCPGARTAGTCRDAAWRRCATA